MFSFCKKVTSYKLAPARGIEDYFFVCLTMRFRRPRATCLRQRGIADFGTKITYMYGKNLSPNLRYMKFPFPVGKNAATGQYFRGIRVAIKNNGSIHGTPFK